MTYADTADVLKAILVCLWIGASAGGFFLLFRGGRTGLLSFLGAELIVQTIASVVLTGILVVPLIRGNTSVDPDPRLQVEYPDFELSPWRALPVLDGGRKKPFESMAIEALRNITGRSKYQGKDATTIVLQWMMLRGEGLDNRDTWEKEPFILCPDGDLRELIYRDLLGPDAELTDEHRRGKFITPEELRKAAPLYQLLLSAEEKELEDEQKATHLFTPLERKAREVVQRLNVFDQLSQNRPTTFGKLAHRQRPDPVGLVGLDRRGGGWLSIGQLRKLREEDVENRDILERKLAEPAGFTLSGLSIDHNVSDLVGKAANGRLMAERLQHGSEWREIMRDRLSRVPQLYISPERLKALEEFQEQIKSGTAQQSLDELAQTLRGRAERTVQEKMGLFAIEEDAAFISFLLATFPKSEERVRILASKEFRDMYSSPGDKRRLFMFAPFLLDFARSQDEQTRILVGISRQWEKGDRLPTLQAELTALMTARDQAILDDLQRRVASAKHTGYHPDDDRFRMLHLNYLESRFPNIYVESSAWQPYPREDVNRILASHEALQKAYKTRDGVLFAAASQSFFDTLSEISAKYDTVNGYPGVDTIALEMQFNRAKPFMWGWIAMLGSILLLVTSMIAGRFEAAGLGKFCYVLGWAAYVASLGLQAFGFYARIAIAGRAPVSNMYETVIFVAAMSAVFAMVLEAVYRKKIMLLGGAAAAWAALVLADQLPNVLDPKISPLVPVLRSNYWLIIHVLTIVASYAGGALAWMLGNIALGMIAFGKPQRETIKTLSQFSYRGMQIAVVLLAAGTFLGGWWAAESWGRFWGWDPKEVWALISLVCYVIPLHARYAGWVKDFGLAVSAVLCFAAIMMSWYGVNFVLGAGLHSYGFGGGGPWWVAWVAILNLVYLLTCCLVHARRTTPMPPAAPENMAKVAALV